MLLTLIVADPDTNMAALDKQKVLEGVHIGINIGEGNASGNASGHSWGLLWHTVHPDTDPCLGAGWAAGDNPGTIDLDTDFK